MGFFVSVWLYLYLGFPNKSSKLMLHLCHIGVLICHKNIWLWIENNHSLSYKSTWLRLWKDRNYGTMKKLVGGTYILT